jgi:hypothetical protein
MKIKALTISAVVLGLAVTAMFPGATDARRSRLDKEDVRMAVQIDKAEDTRAGRFTVSGRFTGHLDGTIALNNRYISITPDTKIFVQGEGIVEDAPVIYGSAIYVQAVRSRGASIATRIYVRAKTRSSYSSASATGILPEDVAR